MFRAYAYRGNDKCINENARDFTTAEQAIMEAELLLNPDDDTAYVEAVDLSNDDVKILAAWKWDADSEAFVKVR